jgi:flagellar FliL protein
MGKRASVAVLLFTMGIGVWWIFLRPRAANSANQSEQGRVAAVLSLESFTVNLADPEEGRFLRATLSLGVEGQLPAAGKGESRNAEPRGVSMATIRDSILSVLTTCKSNDLLTPEGKTKLKADLISALARDVPALQAREVYFTEFLVQR